MTEYEDRTTGYEILATVVGLIAAAFVWMGLQDTVEMAAVFIITLFTFLMTSWAFFEAMYVDKEPDVKFASTKSKKSGFAKTDPEFWAAFRRERKEHEEQQQALEASYAGPAMRRPLRAGAGATDRDFWTRSRETNSVPVTTESATAKSKKPKSAKSSSKAKKAVVGPLRLKKPEGKADDLKLISGVGPKLEKTLNKLGFWHFHQIAKWKKSDVAIVDDELSFKGRIERDDWIKQAKRLAKK